MKVVLLFVATYMCLVMSQIPLNLTGWETLSSASQTNCETIGGYRATPKTMNMYGGRANGDAKYVYNPLDRSYTATDTTANSFSSVPQAVQRGDMLFYYDGSSIAQYDMSTDAVTQISDLSTVDIQTDPALCFDDVDSTKLFVVGDGEIETCEIPLSPSPKTNCTAVNFDPLNMLLQPACQVYNGTIYVFGGVGSGDFGPKNETYACDAETPNACVQLSARLSVARGGIRSVRIPCFADNYVVLMGGRAGRGDEASNAVDVFDLRTETMYSNTDWDMNVARKRFAAVYDPEEEQIFVFGGNTNADWDVCTDSVEVTKTGMEGLCYTAAPTFQPTYQPTFYPTVQPTYQPTSDPTMEPTYQPTYQPTKVPTLNPSLQPTGATDAPTDATSVPSKYPTTSTPTESPVPPTKKPTRKPYSPEVQKEETGPKVYIFMIVILVIICCIVILCAWWFSRQENEENEAGLATAVIITYCDNCGKATPCECDSCNKCGKSGCENDCGLECQNCKRTECDGKVCRQTAQ